jgi:glucosylglycerate phosphorylase
VSPHAERLRAHLDRLYPHDEAARAHAALMDLLERFASEHPQPGAPEGAPFDHRDIVLITYADQISTPGQAPLRTLHDFLHRHAAGAVTGVHLLPFYPWSSDDGFAVRDYFSVDPAVGDWPDVTDLAADFRLMVDGVFNHTSASSSWFRGWRDGDPALERFYISLDPATDLSEVVRPRASPLLTPVRTVRGVEHVWTTFSADQVDLDFTNPAVLLAVTEALLLYVSKGASIVRLDAIAFLWKELGTSCVHLPQTHEVVKLWRTVLEAVAPRTLVITETNVPHHENVEYFGNGYDEAHLVYQFPLAPLVLSAFHLADALTLREWAATLPTPSPQTAFFNFLGSHDGIGLRPAEGLLTSSEINHLADLSRAHGGGVSYRATPEGTLTPYELNTVYFDALTPVDSTEPREVQVDRFLAAQSLLLAMAGVPGVYVHALLGSRNWHEGVAETGMLRSINRRKLDLGELEAELDDPSSLRHAVFHRFLERIRIRVSEPAFHPNAAQRILPGNPSVFAFERTTADGSRSVVCLHNLSGRPQAYAADAEHGLDARGPFIDLVSGRSYDGDDTVEIVLEPYEASWLLNER